MQSSFLKLSVLAIGLSLAGGCGGGGSRTELTSTTVSTGQQLIDLKKALDSGAMTQSEYDRKHKDIMAGK